MRKLALILFALCCVFGGLTLMMMASFHPTFYGVLRFGAAGATPTILGLFLLWDDVLKPQKGKIRPKSPTTQS